MAPSVEILRTVVYGLRNTIQQSTFQQTTSDDDAKAPPLAATTARGSSIDTPQSVPVEEEHEPSLIAFPHGASLLQQSTDTFATLSLHCPMTPLLWMQYAWDTSLLLELLHNQY